MGAKNFPDLLGDHKPAIVIPIFSQLYNYNHVQFESYRDGVKFSPSAALRTSQALYSSKVPIVSYGDLNNDGKDEIIYFEQETSDYLNYNGKIFVPAADKWVDFNTFQSNEPIAPITPGPHQADTSQLEIARKIAFNLLNAPTKIFINDFNGDGLNDILVMTTSGYKILINSGGDNGKGCPNFTSSPYFKDFNSTYDCVRTGDFNGDGLVDFVLCKHNVAQWIFALNNGNMGFDLKYLTTNTIQKYDYTEKDDQADDCIVGDFNNDGKSDLIILNGTYDYHYDNSGHWGTFNKFNTYWYQSTGENVTLVDQNTSPNESDAQVKLYALGNFTGDGRNNLINFGYNCFGSSDYSQKWRLYSTPNINFDRGMITTVSDGFAKNTTISYSTTSAKTNYSTDGTLTSAYPLAILNGSAGIVKQVTVPNGISDDVVQTYTYSNGIVDVKRGFLGFGKFASKNTNTNSTSEQYYDFTATSGSINYYQPFPYYQVNKVNSNVISESRTSVSDYIITPLPNGQHHVFMYPSKSKMTNYLNNSETNTTTNYDTEGNILVTSTVISDKGSSTPVSTVTTKYNNYQSRINGNPNNYKNAPDNIVSEQSHRDQTGVFSSKTDFIYNSNGTIQQKTDFSGTAKALVSTFFYNPVGELSSVTTGDRTATTEYTDDYRFVKKQYNALNQFSELFCDIWGNPLTKWDINRLQTTYSYDDWGNVTCITYPDGKKSFTAINWFDQGNAISYKPESASKTLYYTSLFDENNNFKSAEYFDIAGYSLSKVSSGFNGRIYNTDITYNNLGQTWKVSDPYPSGKTAGNTVTTLYDDYGRVNSQTLSNAVIITTIIDASNVRKITTKYSSGESYTKEYDAAGLLTTATDKGGNITYKYFSTGKPKSIQPSGGNGASVITYNETGLQETLTDPNAGTTTYKYNTFGEMVSQEEPAVNSGTQTRLKTLTYDILGRIKTETLNGITTTYVYDPVGALGQLFYYSKTDGSGLSINYDGFGRVTTETTYNSTDYFRYQYEYDSKGRLSKQTYPNNLALTYNYNSISDDLTKILKDGYPIWSLGNTTSDVNDSGQIVKVSIGSNLYANYRYDTENRIKRIYAQTHNLQNILDFNYDYDVHKLIHSRDEKFYNGTSMVGFKETFGYDDVNRITSATKDNSNSPMTMNYDVITNNRISNKSDIGDYNYFDPSNQKLNNISNLKTLFPRHDVTYTIEGKTSSITETNNGIINKTLNITYGIDGQRIKSEYIQDGTRKYTRYYNKTYEKEVLADGTTRHLNYIYAGNSLIAIFEQKSTGDNLHYAFTDYLGSLRCITSSVGTIEQRLSYDVWGNRRTYDTGLKLTDAQLIDAISLTRRGFTGHEHLDELSLINMNGRVYDPGLGLFMSPDNYVQQPTNSQNFNRYSYCFNNPLLYTDPEGNYAVVDDLVAMGLGGLYNLGSNLIMGNIHSWGQAGGYFLTGMASGEATLYGGPLAGAAVLGFGNSMVSQVSANGWSNVNWAQAGISAGMSMATSSLGSSLSNGIAPYTDELLSGIKNRMLYNALDQGITNGISGFAVNFGMAQMTGSSFSSSLHQGFQGAGFGFGLGLMNGSIESYKIQKQIDLDNAMAPLKPLASISSGEMASPMELKALPLLNSYPVSKYSVSENELTYAMKSAKLQHMFRVKDSHDFGPLLSAESKEALIQDVLLQIHQSPNLPNSGVFNTLPISIGGKIIWTRGFVTQEGMVKIGTMFMQ